MNSDIINRRHHPVGELILIIGVMILWFLGLLLPAVNDWWKVDGLALVITSVAAYIIWLIGRRFL